MIANVKMESIIVISPWEIFGVLINLIGCPVLCSSF